MHVLYIASVWPEARTSGASTRVLQAIFALKSANFTITVASSAKETKESYDFEKAGIKKAAIQLNNTSFDTWVGELAPQIVIFDTFISEEKFGWRIAKYAPNAMRLLDTIEFHSLRFARKEKIKKGLLELPLQNEISLREIASIYRCDLSLFVGDYEIDLVHENFQVSKNLLYYLPLTIPLSTKKTLKSFEERIDFISIGSFLHPPNWDAVLRLKKTIWPQIRKKLPKARLLIVGSYASDKVKQLHNEKEGFIIKGFVEDAFLEMESAKIHLAPMNFGAGIKSKCVLAFQTHTPTITTSIGAEGLMPFNDFAGVVTDDEKNFIDSAIEIYQSKNRFDDANHKADKIISYFSKKSWHQNFIHHIQSLYKNLEKHRKQNFFGKLLLHHQHLSSHYMAKWIEEKEKNKKE